jgi:putative iron-only hydrogenase system regulator
VGISVDNRQETAVHIQELLTDFGDIIVGRMGVPMRDHHVCIISLIVNGETRHVEELAGKLGDIQGVDVTEAYAPVQ